MKKLWILVLIIVISAAWVVVAVRANNRTEVISEVDEFLGRTSGMALKGMLYLHDEQSPWHRDYSAVVDFALSLELEQRQRSEVLFQAMGKIAEGIPVHSAEDESLTEEFTIARDIRGSIRELWELRAELQNSEISPDEGRRKLEVCEGKVVAALNKIDKRLSLPPGTPF